MKILNLLKKWSRMHSECLVCKKTNFKHKSKGVCTSCYDKTRYKENENYRQSIVNFKKNNPEKVKESNRKYHQKNRDRLFKMLGDVCCRCGFEDKRALQIDHINGGGIKERALFNTKDYHRIVLKSLENKEKKYQLLCANCNWIKRHENMEWGK